MRGPGRSRLAKDHGGQKEGFGFRDGQVAEGMDHFHQERVSDEFWG